MFYICFEDLQSFSTHARASRLVLGGSGGGDRGVDAVARLFLCYLGWGGTSPSFPNTQDTTNVLVPVHVFRPPCSS